MSEKQNSLLTGANREFLQGESGHHPTEDSKGRMARKRIRERIRPGLSDFTLLLEGYENGLLTENDLRNIFSLEGSPQDRDPMLDGVRDAIGLFYLAMSDRDEPFDFETRLEGGINRARRAEHGGRPTPTDVQFEVQELPVSTVPEIVSRLGEGEYDSLSEGELRFVLESVFENSDFTVEDYVEAEQKKNQEIADKIRSNWWGGLGEVLDNLPKFPTESGEESGDE